MSDQNLSSQGQTAYFNFEAAVFRLPGAYLAFDEVSGEASQYVPMGGFVACIPFARLRREFEIEPDSHDSRLLNLAGQALKHVQRIYVGDSIPHEIIDGSASWSFSKEHGMIARGRFYHSLLSWAGYVENETPNDSYCLSFADGSFAEKWMGAALEKLAKSVGLDGPQISDQLAQSLDDLAREYAYIIALREHFQVIFCLPEHFEKARNSPRSTDEEREEYARMLALMRIPLRKATGVFNKAKSILDDPPAMVKDHADFITALRLQRDHLRADCRLWKPVLKAWSARIGSRHDTVERRRETYRFLAKNWAAGEEWGMSA